MQSDLRYAIIWKDVRLRLWDLKVLLIVLTRKCIFFFYNISWRIYSRILNIPDSQVIFSMPKVTRSSYSLCSIYKTFFAQMTFYHSFGEKKLTLPNSWIEMACFMQRRLVSLPCFLSMRSAVNYVNKYVNR